MLPEYGGPVNVSVNKLNSSAYDWVYCHSWDIQESRAVADRCDATIRQGAMGNNGRTRLISWWSYLSAAELSQFSTG